MTQCIHQRFLVYGTHCLCGHPEGAAGITPLEACGRCQLRRPPGDFFAQTERLLIKKQTTGEYSPQPKPCGGCRDSVLRRAAHDLQFCWCYWDGGADGDELRFSIRSIEQFFQGVAKITIIGDRPEWYQGHHIPKKRVPASRPQREYRDMLGKVWFIATHPEVDEKSVWMMDDVYAIKPFTAEDLEIPRAERWRPSRKNRWQRIKTNTMNALAREGFTQHDYATHAPHVAEKGKLVEIFNRFDLHNNVMLWEVLYGNVFRGKPRSSRYMNWFARFYEQMTADQYRLRLTHSTFFNHTSGAWCRGLFDYLSELLPNPSTAETGQPQFRRVKRQAGRQLLERQWYTTRAYKEKIAKVLSSVHRVSDAGTAPHFLLVQSSYGSGLTELSRFRLDVSRQTIIPSLAAQTLKPIVVLSTSPDDAYRDARIAAFESTGCEVRVTTEPWKLYGMDWGLPEGRKIVSRCDDDDVLAMDFIADINAAAPHAGEFAIIYPNGYVFWRDQLFALDHPENQFVSLVTDQQRDPHQEKHVKIPLRWQTVVAQEKAPGWIWIRHANAVTPTVKRYREKPIGRIDTTRFPHVNLRAIQRIISKAGQPAGHY